MWFDFIRENFDKLLLACLFLLIFSADIHMAYHMADPSVVAWGRESAGTVLGGLLGLITGFKLAKATMSTTAATKDASKDDHV